ncbi:MAG: hypothetical protein LBG42_00160 [Treponema sp.]|jgi:hypothetical protein|nr:hypothetical protein [Treponema sp.]
MAKKSRAIYAPGELNRVRGKLGELDLEEAKRMAKILGGEVGYERTIPQEEARHKSAGRTRHETVDMVVGRNGTPQDRPKRRVEVAPETAKAPPKKAFHHREGDPSDNPAIPLKASYFERVKMDKYAGEPEFDIKSPGQIFISMLSIFSEPPDYVNPSFVSKRLNEYYRRIENLVVSTRTLFPRNNAKRSEKLKRVSPFVFSILDTIRYWNIERITGDMAKIQSHPRTVKAQEFSDILKAIYRPLFILRKLDPDIHIKGAYKLLYRLLYIENPMDAKKKYQEHIRTALLSYNDVRRDIHYFLYPLLLKLLSDRWLPYEMFFLERKNRFMFFINADETDCILPQAMAAREMETGELSAGGKTEDGDDKNPDGEEEDPDSPEVQARKAKEAAAAAEKKALDRGLVTLETLFPRAGWDRLSTFPDLYSYFADIFNLKNGYELIAPTDPLQQVAVLMRIVEDLCFGLRYITFGSVTGADGDPVRIDDFLGNIINHWQQHMDMSFGREYLPRLREYCHILENSAESRTSNYAKRILNELHWTKRLFFLPHYKFESVMPSTIRKGDVTPIYPEIRRMRKYLTSVAAGIEQGSRQGGAEKQAPCDGIDNPWEPYNFEVPTPLSTRLDSLLDPRKRNNAALVFFSLSVIAVLDHLVNNETSWAYENRPGPLFRSINGEGIMPLFGVETKIDADLIFRQTMKDRERARQKAAEQEKDAGMEI